MRADAFAARCATARPATQTGSAPAPAGGARDAPGARSGYRSIFPEESVEFIERATRRFRLKSDAGRWIETEFCENCGTTVTWTLEFLPGERGIAGGSFDEPTFWYKLQRYVFARTKPDWLKIPDDIEVIQAMTSKGL